MKIKEIYTEKFLDEIAESHYLLHKDVEEWTPKDWNEWSNMVMNLINLQKKLEKQKMKKEDYVDRELIVKDIFRRIDTAINMFLTKGICKSFIKEIERIKKSYL